MNLSMFNKEDLKTKKENVIDRFRTLPNRKISDIEKQMVFIIIEKSKIKRERSMIILNKGFLIFFAFIIITALVRLNEVIPQFYLNIVFLFGIGVLVIAVMLYHGVISEEEKNLDKLLESFLG